MTPLVPIHVAIPAYNNASGLRRLLPQVVRQNVASITVLDDGSTDDTEEVVSMFVGVRYVKAERNLGPVAAKNLILQQLPSEGYVLFIDSDMDILTPDIAQRLSQFVNERPNLGAGGGTIRTIEGTLMPSSKGYDLSPLRFLIMAAVELPARLLGVFKIRIKGASISGLSLDNVDASRKVDWVAEGFFFIRVDLFRDHGGFDQRFIRFHEGPDLCLWLRSHGHEVWYVATIEAQHLDQSHGATWWRRWQWFRSWGIYLWKHPTRLLLWGVPKP